jgi:hypothetical protein
VGWMTVSSFGTAGEIKSAIQDFAPLDLLQSLMTTPQQQLWKYTFDLLSAL